MKNSIIQLIQDIAGHLETIEVADRLVKQYKQNLLLQIRDMSPLEIEETLTSLRGVGELPITGKNLEFVFEGDTLALRVPEGIGENELSHLRGALRKEFIPFEESTRRIMVPQEYSQLTVKLAKEWRAKMQALKTLDGFVPLGGASANSREIRRRAERLSGQTKPNPGGQSD